MAWHERRQNADVFFTLPPLNEMFVICHESSGGRAGLRDLGSVLLGCCIADRREEISVLLVRTGC